MANATYYSPHLDPDGWKEITLGPYRLGGDASKAVFKPGSKSAIKKDGKKKAGKSKAKVTTQGLEQWKGTIEWSFMRRDWDPLPSYSTEQNVASGEEGVEATLYALDPAGKHGGGPFPLDTMQLGPFAPKSILITSVSWPIQWNGEVGTVTLEWEEAEIQPAPSAGGGGGTGTGRVKLTEFEKVALLTAIKALKQRIATEEELLRAASTQAARDARQAEIASLKKSLADAEKRLVEGSAPATPPTETKNADQNAATKEEGKSGDDTVTLYKSAKKAYTGADAPTAKP